MEEFRKAHQYFYLAYDDLLEKCVDVSGEQAAECREEKNKLVVLKAKMGQTSNVLLQKNMTLNKEADKTLNDLRLALVSCQTSKVLVKQPPAEEGAEASPAKP
jgi:hypothetical protein